MISGNNIVARSGKGNKTTKQQTRAEIILELRKKYPELKALDDLISDWKLFKPDDELLNEYFNQRAKR